MQMVYFHSSAMTIALEEQQFNLDMIAKVVGSSKVTGANVWAEETVALTGNAGSVVGTPIATSSGNIYGWVTKANGDTERVTFSTKAFTSTQSGGSVCVRYYKLNSAATSVTVNANIIPSVVRLVLDAQLFSGDSSSISTSTLVGKVLIEIPKAQIEGSVSIELSSSGTSKTPMKAIALNSASTGCGSGAYATIIEVVDNANWYDSIQMLAIPDDTLTISTASPTVTLDVYAIPRTGDAFKCDNTLLTFASSDATKATVSASGVVTRAATGATVISISITGASSITATANITVGA